MEILSFEGGAQTSRKKKPLGLVLGVAAVAGVMVLGSTLAEGVAVSGGAITFGQGVAQATACDNAITLTPGADFTNTAGAGSFVLKTIRVSNLDATACDGKTFIIKAYGNASSTPLTLYSSATAITSVVAATKNQSTALPSGATVSSAATTEILYTITTPTLAAGDIFKLTIEQQS
jgi:hypothetical protein